MKYQYTVKHNGVWYPAGEEVPTDDTHLNVTDTADTANAPKPNNEIVAKKRGGRKPRI